MGLGLSISPPVFGGPLNPGVKPILRDDPLFRWTEVQLPPSLLKGTAFRPSVITIRQWRLEAIRVAGVMYELKLVPFSSIAVS